MSGTIAIDFGTARTKLAFRPPGGGRPELMRFAEDRPFAPSLFYLPPGDGPALWGDDAEDMLSEDPAGVLVALKRDMSRPKVRANARSEAPTALLACLLADLRERAGQQVAHLGGRPPGRAALTAPALFGPDEEGLLREAALAAGFEEAEVVSEPEAAARAWLAETGEAADEVIVLDCGGGTVDWAWLRRRDGIFRLVADCPPDGRRDVGGHDVDEALLEAVREALTGDAEALREIEAERPRYLARVRGIKESVGQGRAPRPLRVGRREVALDAARVQAAAEAWLVTRTLEGLLWFFGPGACGAAAARPRGGGASGAAGGRQRPAARPRAGRGGAGLSNHPLGSGGLRRGAGRGGRGRRGVPHA